MSRPESVLVVGASAAGLSTVETLRNKGYTGAVTVLGAEPHPPYDRPPLSKQVLAGTREPEAAALRSQAALSKLDAEFVLGDAAVGMNVAERTVRTRAGRVLHAETVVAATGARPRTLPGQQEVGGVHVLRTLDDAFALRAQLRTASRLVVVGEGVLGAEIAATARGMGLAVTMAGPQAAPMTTQLGPFNAGRLAELHAAHGVQLRLGTGVDGFTTDSAGHVTGLRMDDGELLRADLVVVAVGAVPVTDWLDGSGVRVDDGIVCDARCRAADNVYAVGDVARWWHERKGAHVRLENRTNATAQAAAVAANILGADNAYTPIPYFWTDQYDARLQMHGFLSPDADVTIVDGDPAAGRFVARYRQNGATTGVLGWNMAKQAGIYRKEIA